MINLDFLATLHKQFECKHFDTKLTPEGVIHCLDCGLEVEF